MKPPFLISSLALLLLSSCETAPKKKERAAPIPLPASQPAQADRPVGPTVDASGVVTTASGLRYRVVTSGPSEGRSPSSFDSVLVHYRGTLVDGTVFDSSYERGSPATFGVGQVIPGWTEALKLMKPGDKWILQIPSRLAYGGQGAGSKIPPNSDLTFEVELLHVIPAF